MTTFIQAPPSLVQALSNSILMTCNDQIHYLEELHIKADISVTVDHQVPLFVSLNDKLIPSSQIQEDINEGEKEDYGIAEEQISRATQSEVQESSIFVSEEKLPYSSPHKKQNVFLAPGSYELETVTLESSPANEENSAVDWGSIISETPVPRTEEEGESQYGKPAGMNAVLSKSQTLNLDNTTVICNKGEKKMRGKKRTEKPYSIHWSNRKLHGKWIPRRVRKLLQPSRKIMGFYYEPEDVVDRTIIVRADRSLDYTLKPGVEKQRLKCNFCTKQFSRFTNLNQHLFNEHQQLAYQCELCKSGFITQKELMTHIDLEHNQGTHHLRKCHICQQEIYWYNLKNHFKNHSRKDLFKCEFCDFRHNTSKFIVKMHMPFDHPDKVGDGRIQCPECNSLYRSKAALKLHLETSHTEGPRERPFKCTQCPKAFHTQRSLENHFKNVHNPKELAVCQYCGIKFKHTNRKRRNHPLFCKENPDRIIRKQGYTRRRKSAVGLPRPPDPGWGVLCERCNLRTTKRHFIYHEIFHHVSDSLGKDTPLLCSLCKLEGYGPNSIQRGRVRLKKRYCDGPENLLGHLQSTYHVRKICEYCTENKESLYPKALTEHMLKKHPDEDAENQWIRDYIWAEKEYIKIAHTMKTESLSLYEAVTAFYAGSNKKASKTETAQSEGVDAKDRSIDGSSSTETKKEGNPGEIKDDSMVSVSELKSVSPEVEANLTKQPTNTAQTEDHAPSNENPGQTRISQTLTEGQHEALRKWDKMGNSLLDERLNKILKIEKTWALLLAEYIQPGYIGMKKSIDSFENVRNRGKQKSTATLKDIKLEGDLEVLSSVPETAQMFIHLSATSQPTMVTTTDSLFRNMVFHLPPGVVLYLDTQQTVYVILPNGKSHGLGKLLDLYAIKEQDNFLRVEAQKIRKMITKSKDKIILPAPGQETAIPKTVDLMVTGDSQDTSQGARVNKQMENPDDLTDDKISSLQKTPSDIDKQHAAALSSVNTKDMGVVDSQDEISRKHSEDDIKNIDKIAECKVQFKEMDVTSSPLKTMPRITFSNPGGAVQTIQLPINTQLPIIAPKPAVLPQAAILPNSMAKTQSTTDSSKQLTQLNTNMTPVFQIGGVSPIFQIQQSGAFVIQPVPSVPDATAGQVVFKKGLTRKPRTRRSLKSQKYGYVTSPEKSSSTWSNDSASDDDNLAQHLPHSQSIKEESNISVLQTKSQQTDDDDKKKSSRKRQSSCVKQGLAASKTPKIAGSSRVTHCEERNRKENTVSLKSAIDPADLPSLTKSSEAIQPGTSPPADSQDSLGKKTPSAKQDKTLDNDGPETDINHSLEGSQSLTAQSKSRAKLIHGSEMGKISSEDLDARKITPRVSSRQRKKKRILDI